MKYSWEVTEESPQHLRTFLNHRRISRALLKSIKFNGGKILVNNRPTRTNALVVKGDVVKVVMPVEQDNPHVKPIDQPIDVVFENENYLVVNKPPYLPTVQSAGNQVDTLVNRVKFYLIQHQNESSVVHVVTRLDQDTAGLVIFAKHRFAHSVLDQEMQNGKIQKIYTAIIQGHLSKSHGMIDLPIKRDPTSFIKRMVSVGGRESKTEYWLLESHNDNTLVKVQLHSGRTHQIRVHFSYLNHPLVGDELYGEENLDLRRQALVCNYLEFHDVLADTKVQLKIDLPKDMKEYWEKDGK